MRLPLTLAALLACLCAAAQPGLPASCLWIRAGIVMTQPETLRIPAGLRKAADVSRVWQLGDGRFAWTEEHRDWDGSPKRFRLRIAETAGQTQDLLTDLDPFGTGDGWRILDLGLAEGGGALDVRVRLSGSGLQSEVYRVSLTKPYPVEVAPEGTRVWASRSADGNIKAVDTWALTADDETLADNQRRYASIVVAGLSNPQGRMLWTLQAQKALPPWAGWLITSVVVAPDGKSVVYANPCGIWQAAIAGGTPKRLWPVPPLETVDQLLWAPDAGGVYFTRRPMEGSATGEREPYLAYLKLGTARAEKVLEQAENLLVCPAQ